MASLAEKVIRLAVKLVAFASPERAGALAFDIFSTTPSKKPKGEKEMAALAHAAPRMAQAERVSLVIPGSLVATHVFRPDREIDRCALVLLVHGYGSRSDHMVTLADALVAGGSTVVCLDLPGHGMSTGRRLHLANAVEAIDAAWRQFGPFDAMVGHSFGGPSVIAAAAGAIASIPARIPARIVTIGSPTALPDLFDWFAARFRLSKAVRTAFEQRVLHLSGHPLSHFHADRMLATLPVKALVIHAEDDKEVAFSNAERLADAGAHVRLVRANGYGHRRIVASPPTLAAIGAFLKPSAGDSGAQGVAKSCLSSGEVIAAPAIARRLA